MKTIVVQAIYEREVVVPDYNPNNMDLEQFAKEITKEHVKSLSPNDFDYKIKSVTKVF